MSLPVPNLDDLRFQKDLVDEARRRIISYCPEWTDYNLSDPGITLIELFAWMTEQMIYRLNRVPEKNYIKFLELLGTRLQPASSASVELTFRLSTPFPIGPEDDTVVVVPAGTEAATRETEERPEITFTTDNRLVIQPPKLVQLRRDKEFQKNYLPRLGVEPCVVFDEVEPKQGDTFYLGFDETQPLNGYILRLVFQCEQTQAVGIRREDPPLVWECSLGDGRWQEITPSTHHGERDTTGGLNNEEGQMVFYLPLSMRPDVVNGRNGYWIRCRFDQRRPEQGVYSESPRITRVEAFTLGATVRASHAVIVTDEILGISNGEPGQIFRVQHAPLLALQDGETVEVEENRNGEMVFVPWQSVPDFSASSRYDRHFVLDTATGEVRFGPAVRQQDGSVRQYGRIPETGSRIRFARYRYGGGVIGNVPPGQIQVLKRAVPYIDRVVNLVPATGGRDQETLEEAQMRMQRELRAQSRAVTAEDFESLAKKATRRVGRVKCNPPDRSGRQIPSGVVELLVVPAVAEALRAGNLAALHVDDKLVQEVTQYLDDFRLLTTILRVREPQYLGIQVRAEIVPDDYRVPDEVAASVIDRLNHFITPLPLADNPAEPGYEGWPFGRDLYVAEIFSLIQQTPGVKHVLDVSVYTRPVVPAEEQSPASEKQEKMLQPVSENRVRAEPDMLYCSLAHQITTTRLGD